MRKEDKERWFNGYLPHFHSKGAVQFLTWRLADSLPVEKYLAIKNSDQTNWSHVQRETEMLLDQGLGSCVLSQMSVGSVVCDTLIEIHRRKAIVHAFSVMPNHVHLLLTLCEGVELSKLMKEAKGSTSRAINLILKRNGRLWQPDYFDRMIRDAEHFEKVAAYIEWNPVKAKLVVAPSEYQFSSANVYWAKLLGDKVE